jgi:hypothetical protein
MRQRSQLGGKASSSKPASERNELDEDIALFPPNIAPEEAYIAMLYEYGRSVSRIIRGVSEWRKRKPRWTRGDKAAKNALNKHIRLTKDQYSRLRRFLVWEAGPPSCQRYGHLNEVLQLFPEWPKPYLLIPQDQRQHRIRQGLFPHLWDYKVSRKTLLDVTASIPDLTPGTTLFHWNAKAEKLETEHRLNSEESIISQLNTFEAAIGSKKQYFVFAIDFQDSKSQAFEDFKAWAARYERNFQSTSSKTQRGRRLAPLEALKHLAAYRALQKHPNAPAKAATLLEENGFPWRGHGNTNRSSIVLDAAKRGEKKLHELFPSIN